MKKTSLLFLILLLLLVGAWFWAKPKIAHGLANATHTFLSAMDPAYASVQADIIPNTCQFLPCITLKNTRVTLWNIPVSGGEIKVALRPHFPLSLEIQTLPADVPPQFTLNVTTRGPLIDVHSGTISIGTFYAALNGRIDTEQAHIDASLSTVNLASFLIPLLPQNVQFLAQLFLSNAPQTLKVTDENGWATVQGLPLFPLR